MPIHNWTRAPVGLFHHFHQRWSVAVCDALNAGALPDGYFALIEQSAARYWPDVMTLREGGPSETRPELRGGIAVADAPPKTQYVSRATEAEAYTLRANRVVVRSSGERIVSAIEIVSPGNKASKRALETFLDKSIEFLARGVNLLVIDLFPPTRRDPQGLHPLIWDEIHDDAFALPKSTPLTLASYAAGPPSTAYVQPVAAGAILPEMPLFIEPDIYIPAPLEPTYEEAWQRCPRQFRDAVLKEIG